MSDLLENIQNISIEGDSRSARWKSLRGHLKQLVKIIDENNDTLVELKTEVSRIQEFNLKLTEVVQKLSDLTNEEVQREISLTLNDMDYDIVIDTPTSDIPAIQQHESVEKENALAIDESVEIPSEAPDEDAKASQEVSVSASQKHECVFQPSLNFEIEGEPAHD